MNITDLTHPFSAGDLSFPDDPKVAIIQHGKIATHRYNISQIVTGSHQGTHLDAMYHFFEDGRTIDKMPLEWFYGPARVLRLPKGTGAKIDVDDLMPFEEHFHAEAKIILNTGWHRQFGTPAFFDKFPSLTIEAAEFIAGKKIRLLGMDMPSLGVDYYELHRALLAPETEIVVVESLTNLDTVPDEFIFSGFPLNLSGLDGSPIRAVAIY